ncbi:transcriptional regulator [Actinomadura darangshiensis]|uniref:Transcriptional regulator n=1 Tax=Actinomadura darangshiensis TaxID=705336 RepID=A0A4R5BTW4_9ACTN|nr:helix-turn-helix domain-containing protein [Actinomadura darangshiensis]TDD89545.1 transcriptional regulator [Actinomadura darangshiensis]
MVTMTAAQRREREKAAFDAYMDACPTHQLMGIIGNKWSTMVLMDLAHGARRYAEVSNALPGVSAKMLTQTLRSLERDGFVTRTVTPAVPVQVEYTLTLLGERIVPLITSMQEWADRHMDEIDAARKNYDDGRHLASG